MKKSAYFDSFKNAKELSGCFNEDKTSEGDDEELMMESMNQKMQQTKKSQCSKDEQQRLEFIGLSRDILEEVINGFGNTAVQKAKEYFFSKFKN